MRKKEDEEIDIIKVLNLSKENLPRLSLLKQYSNFCLFICRKIYF